MRDEMSLGPSPSEEECAQVGTPDYLQKAKEECQRYINLIRKHLGNEPEGARLSITHNNHDFGIYLDVVCKYNDENEEAVNYAFKCEAEAPTHWDGTR